MDRRVFFGFRASSGQNSASLEVRTISDLIYNTSFIVFSLLQKVMNAVEKDDVSKVTPKFNVTTFLEKNSSCISRLLFDGHETTKREDSELECSYGGSGMVRQEDSSYSVFGNFWQTSSNIAKALHKISIVNYIKAHTLKTGSKGIRKGDKGSMGVHKERRRAFILEYHIMSFCIDLVHVINPIIRDLGFHIIVIVVVIQLIEREKF